MIPGPHEIGRAGAIVCAELVVVAIALRALGRFLWPKT